MPSHQCVWLTSLKHYLTCIVTVQWFTVKEQTLTATVWQAMFGLATAIGNLLAYGFYHIKGVDPLRGWQWMTLTISLISWCASGKLEIPVLVSR